MKAKKYKLDCSVRIIEDGEAYSPKVPIAVAFSEIIPEGTDPIKYLRERLTEEIRRADHNHAKNLQWKDETKTEEQI